MSIRAFRTRGRIQYCDEAMFKIIRVEPNPEGLPVRIEPPAFIFFCDEPGCGAIAKGPFPFEDPREGQAVCANLVCQLGWLLDFDAHRCPGHAKQLMSVRNLIQPATRIPDLGRTN